MASTQNSLECAALMTRMAARSVTNAYDRALRPAKLRITQFSLLMAVRNQASAMSIKGLAERLGMDRTTLIRNLKVLEKDGLVEIGPEGYRRAKAMRLTAAGEAKLEEAFPLWERAQEAFVAQLGDDNWSTTKDLLERLNHTA